MEDIKKLKLEIHYEKYKLKLSDESKNLFNFGFKFFKSIFLIFIYAFTVLGDFLLIAYDKGNTNTEDREKKPKKKNILDGGI